MPELDLLFRVAMSITKNTANAEDLVQETLLRAYRSIDRFDGEHPRAWLLTIMRNAHINSLRRRRPELLRDPDSQMERIADPAGHASSAESVVMEGTFDAAVEAAYNELPTRFRRVVGFVDMDGLSSAGLPQMRSGHRPAAVSGHVATDLSLGHGLLQAVRNRRSEIGGPKAAICVECTTGRAGCVSVATNRRKDS